MSALQGGYYGYEFLSDVLWTYYFYHHYPLYCHTIFLAFVLMWISYHQTRLAYLARCCMILMKREARKSSVGGASV